MDGVVLEDGRSDASASAELASLRRRAYGLDGDIGSDPRALRRLSELEDAVVRERAAAASGALPAPRASRIEENPHNPAGPTGVHRRVSSILDAVAPVPSTGPAPGPDSAPGPGQAAAPEPPAIAPPRRAGRTPRPRVRRRTAVIAASVVAVIAVGLGSLGLMRTVTAPDLPPTTRSAVAPAVLDARKAYSFAWDTDAVMLLNIPLDGSFGRYIDLPSRGPIPAFPSTGTVRWVADLGRYFGWEVWIAGASVGDAGLQREHCILIHRDDMVRSRCVPAAVRAQSALLVSVSFASVDEDERPVGMGDDQRLGFWWRHDRSVTVVIGDEP